MRIRMIINGVTLDAALEDTRIAREFAAMLPPDLTLEDHSATEKIGDLPARLSTVGAPAGVTPAVGDISYYEP